jgi:hypothetical protein
MHKCRTTQSTLWAEWWAELDAQWRPIPVHSMGETVGQSFEFLLLVAGPFYNVL